MKKWLFNPFIYLAGARALIIGWAAMLLTALIAFYSKTHFDGVIDLHVGRVSTMPVYFCEQLIDWGCVTIVFYVAGMIFSKSAIRFIDIAGTFALTRWVMIFPALFAFGIKVPETIRTMKDLNTTFDYSPGTIGPIILMGIISMVFAIWMVALMYNAFTVSCNIKGGKATGIFIGALVIVEIVSHLILHQFYKHFI